MNVRQFRGKNLPICRGRSSGRAFQPRTRVDDTHKALECQAHAPHSHDTIFIYFSILKYSLAMQSATSV